MIIRRLKETPANRSCCLITVIAERPFMRAEKGLIEYFDGETRMYKTEDGTRRWVADIYDSNFLVSNNRDIIPVRRSGQHFKNDSGVVNYTALGDKTKPKRRYNKKAPK